MADLGFLFLLGFAGGRLEFVTQAFGDSPKLSSSGLGSFHKLRLHFLAFFDHVRLYFALFM
jgi:hypothetical protein